MKNEPLGIMPLQVLEKGLIITHKIDKTLNVVNVKCENPKVEIKLKHFFIYEGETILFCCKTNDFVSMVFTFI